MSDGGNGLPLCCSSRMCTGVVDLLFCLEAA
jgi:hypothetical protein